MEQFKGGSKSCSAMLDYYPINFFSSSKRAYKKKGLRDLEKNYRIKFLILHETAFTKRVDTQFAENEKPLDASKFCLTQRRYPSKINNKYDFQFSKDAYKVHDTQVIFILAVVHCVRCTGTGACQRAPV